MPARTNKGWLTKAALLSGLTEQAAWAADGEEHTVELRIIGGHGISPLYQVKHTIKSAIAESSVTSSEWTLAAGRDRFKKEAHHA